MNSYKFDYIKMNGIVKKTLLVVPFSIITILLLFYPKPEKTNNLSSMENNGIVIKNSALDFETTYEKLRGTLEANPNLKIVLELDHSKNAASKGLDLRPTRIIVFGNPLLGTPLMKNQPTLAIDLPQKIVVYQLENGNVEVAYNNPLYLKERHGIEGNDEVLTKIAGALNKITDAAIGN